MKQQDREYTKRDTTAPYRVDANAEDEYWRSTYKAEPYVSDNYSFDDDYLPAYRLGYDGRTRYLGRSYDEVEEELSNEWNEVKGDSRLMWDDARQAVRAGWHRVERALPGDFDNDGR